MRAFMTCTMRLSLSYFLAFLSVIIFPVCGEKRQPGHNCFPRRSMHGACDVDENGNELACLNIDGYFQCAPALEQGQRCGIGNLFNECRRGLWCPGAGAACQVAPNIGNSCAAKTSFDSRNVCGFQGFCIAETYTCREFITSTVPFEDSCTPDTNYGYHECASNLTCQYYWNEGNPYGTCVPRFREDDDKHCGDQDCADGLRCDSSFGCLPLSHIGGKCNKQFDCLGNLMCEVSTNTCQLRSMSDPQVIDIVPNQVPVASTVTPVTRMPASLPPAGQEVSQQPFQTTNKPILDLSPEEPSSSPVPVVNTLAPTTSGGPPWEAIGAIAGVLGVLVAIDPCVMKCRKQNQQQNQAAGSRP